MACPRQRVVPFLAAVVLTASLWGAAPDPTNKAIAEASRFIQNASYADAVRVLTADMAGRPDAELPQHLILLGEAHYLARQYAEAKTALTRAMAASTVERLRSTAEYRLICTLYRLKDAQGFLDRVDGWLRGRTFDDKSATVQLYRIELLSAQGMKARQAIEAAHRSIIEQAAVLKPETVAAAHQLLSNFMTSAGSGAQALALFEDRAKALRVEINQLDKAKKPVPPATTLAYETVCLQIGVILVEARKATEAARWLEQVRSVPELVGKARLLLAKSAVEGGKPQDAASYLLRDGVFAKLPPDLKNDAALILGLAERRVGGDPAKVESYLGMVTAGSPSHVQAQVILGDLYRDRGLIAPALKAYAVALDDPAFLHKALFGVASAHLSAPAVTPQAATAAAIAVQTLLAKAPLTSEAQQAKRLLVPKLAAAGLDVSFARSADDQVEVWTGIARAKPGSGEAVQALISLARNDARSIRDAAGTTIIRAPDWSAVAKWTGTVLDAAVYHGKDLTADAWRLCQAEALLLRAQAELASVDPAKPRLGDEAPTPVPSADAARAVTFFERALPLIPDTSAALLRQVRLGLVEAQLKCPGTATQASGAQRFAALETDYGGDADYHLLAWTIADWYRDKGRAREAAEQYAWVAAKAKDLSQDDRLRLYGLAGQLGSVAAKQAAADTTKQAWALRIVSTSGVQLSSDPLVASKRLARELTWTWPSGGKLTAAAALEHIARTARQPMVWAGRSDSSKKMRGLAGELAARQVQLSDGRQTIAAAIATVLRGTTCGAAWDVGLSGGDPTGALPDPDSATDRDEAVRLLEIYDTAVGLDRFAMLAKPFGQLPAAKGALLLSVLDRVTEQSGLPLLWTSGIDKDAKLGADLGKLDLSRNATIGQALRLALAPHDLAAEVVRQDIAGSLYQQANEWFNTVIREDPKSELGEKAMFQVAMNCRAMGRGDIMLTVLRRYLSIFDGLDAAYGKEANFYLGEQLAADRRNQEAVAFFAAAAAERVHLLPFAGTATAAANVDDARRARLHRSFSYETNLGLNAALANDRSELDLDLLRDLLRKVHLDLRLDAGVPGSARFAAPTGTTTGFDLLCAALAGTACDARAVHLQPDIAEFALLAMARAYLADELLPQAAEACALLADRYPQGRTRQQALQVQLDVARGQRDFRTVLSTLEAMIAAFGDDPLRRQRIIGQLAWLRYEMADYEAAIAQLSPLIASAAGAERTALRQSLGLAQLRAARWPEAAATCDALSSETGAEGPVWAVAAAAARLMANPTASLPVDWASFVDAYAAEADPVRRARPAADHRKVAWIHWATAQFDRRAGRASDALTRLEAAGSSSDQALAGQALLEAAALHAAAGRAAKARETLEFILFQNKDAEICLRTLMALGDLHSAAGRTDEAAKRYAAVLDRYPLSPLARRAAEKLGVPPPDLAPPDLTPAPAAPISTKPAAKPAAKPATKAGSSKGTKP